MRSVYGYCRVSTFEQSEHGLSLETQRRQLAGYCQMKGWKLTKVFVERGVSGSRPLETREQGGALLACLQQGDTVVATKLDRAFRSALDALSVLGRLKRQKVSLHLLDLGGDVTGDGIAKLVFTILSAVAEAERERTRERIRDVKKSQREQGRYLGGSTQFGFRKTRAGMLVPHPAEQNAIRRMRQLRAKGKSFRAIAAATRAAGHQISHAAVRNALRLLDDREVGG